jgi:hypothetical protein
MIDGLGLEPSSPYNYDPLYDAVDRSGREALEEAKQDLKKRQEAFDVLTNDRKVGQTRPDCIFEYCGRICRHKNQDGSFCYYKTGPVTLGKHGSCDPTLAPACKPPDITVGVYHNHPGSERISGFYDDPGGDKKVADRGKSKSMEYKKELERIYRLKMLFHRKRRLERPMKTIRAFRRTFTTL